MQKTNKVLLGVLGCCLLLLLTMQIPNSTAGVVWYDYFSDGFDNWTVGDGSFSAADCCLEATGDDWNTIEHECSVAYGSWSFDFYSNDSLSHSRDLIQIYLVADQLQPNQDNPYEIALYSGYNIFLDPNFMGEHATYQIWRYDDGNWPTEILPQFDVFPVDILTGWYHIKITRDCTGTYNFYRNDTLIFHFTDNTHSNPTLFGFGSKPGQAFDNVVVSELDTLCSGGGAPIPLELVLIGVGVIVAVVVIVIIGVFFYRRRTP